MKKKIAVLASLVLFIACLSYRGFDIVKNDLILKIHQKAGAKPFFLACGMGSIKCLELGFCKAG